MGYKIRYARSDGRGQPLVHVIHDRVEREYTIEDLEEWTEYRVQVQAFNAIGSGPWSHSVVGRTRESGTAAHPAALSTHPSRIQPLTPTLITPSVPSSGPSNVSALATSSSSMLVRWSDIPEADCNGFILGYKVSTYPSPGPVALPAHSPAHALPASPADLGSTAFPGENHPGPRLCHLREMVPICASPGHAAPSRGAQGGS